MKIVEIKTSGRKLKNKNPLHDYSSWDPFTQAKYLFDLHQNLGSKITDLPLRARSKK